MVLVSLSKTMRIYTRFLLGSIYILTASVLLWRTIGYRCTYHPPRTVLAGTDERLRPLGHPKEEHDCLSLAITFVHEHAHTLWTSEIGKLSLAQIATTRVDHNEACNSPSD